jgi:hypothetical protein
MAEETIIREFRKDDLGAIVELSLRAWEPVFASVRKVLGDDIFLRLHPVWKEDQADEVRSVCANEERDVFVAVTGGRPVGFVAVALNAFHEGMGAIDIIGVGIRHLRPCASVPRTCPVESPLPGRPASSSGRALCCPVPQSVPGRLRIS